MSPARKNHIILTMEQRDALKQIVNDDTPSRGRRARALLLVDEGEFGPAITFSEAAERVKLDSSTVSDLVERVQDMGVIEAAMGRRGQFTPGGRGKGTLPRLSAEQHEEVASLFATGEFTKAELGRRYGVSPPTIGRAIQRHEGGNHHRR